MRSRYSGGPTARNSWLCLAIATLACSLVAGELQATQVRPINLEEMTHAAGSIFAGRCTGVAVERDARLGVDVMVATFKVQRAVKGHVGKVATVRMLLTAAGDALPFRKGEDVVLFLYGEGKLGLSSPVGLGQGKFTVVDDPKQKRKLAVNRFGNRDLLGGLTPGADRRIAGPAQRTRERGGLDPSDLLDMAEALRQ